MATKTASKKDEAVMDAVVEYVEQPAPDYYPGENWYDTAADTVAGFDLAKEEILDALEGVPFRITRLVFRRGINHMVSVEAVIAPEEVLKRRRIGIASLPFEPLSQIVFNDGSTGIYRQLIEYLVARDYIEIDDDKPVNGPMGESRYDVRADDFTNIKAGVMRYKEDGEFEYSINVRLDCPRGLRISEYENDANPSGSKTRYLA